MSEFVEMVAPTVGGPCGQPGGCGDGMDHTCVAGSASGRGRCSEHCTCLGEPVGYAVSLTVTLPTQAAAQILARRLSEVTGGYAAGTPHVTVTQTALGPGA